MTTLDCQSWQLSAEHYSRHFTLAKFVARVFLRGKFQIMTFFIEVYRPHTAGFDRVIGTNIARKLL
ncbi:hypothetical protein J6590_058118 [Homalodisca vitripennis]|nr:hypothetical protein J6590_058118 [Homalodisca vitripennis]